ncbi:DUF1453 domain-containing protein [Clostridium drakei]|uniref:DUF1453 domain-containing protein n=1 Tax=Clostridium drakei TaxID=332101 RepID=UPI000A7CA79F|nr:DUF1453 domain-containing protein [Clostridium drakei]
MSIVYLILIVIVLKFFRILNGKSKRIKFPNLWLIPILFIIMIVEDYVKVLNFSLKEILIISIFSIIGLGVGIIRGGTLKYSNDEAKGEVYYNESYLSLGVYVFLIVIKCFFRYAEGDISSFISIWILVFGCASMIGRSIWLTYKYFQISGVVQ